VSIQIISIGTRMPQWTNDAYLEYAKRLPRTWQTTLTEVNALKRLKNTDLDKVKQFESAQLWSAQTRNSYSIALDRTGQKTSSIALSTILQSSLQKGQKVAFLIGGPEGISDDTLNKSNKIISLSDLTFPHPLVRVILIEQIYRAWCISAKRTYHR
jgi:23S rRNA (pseudouridine1915-N3)-methyltransferase